MMLAPGPWEKITRKHGTFGDYDVRGDLVADSQFRRGWLIQLDGLESGSFAVRNGEIRRAGLEYFAGSSRETSVAVSPEIADLRASAKKAMFDAVAQWEAEEREKPPSS